jgi:selenocysteine lyase/cysteine desulfurase
VPARRARRRIRRDRRAPRFSQEVAVVSRRQFITTSVAATAASLAPGKLLAALREQTLPTPDLSRWADIKAQFDLKPGQIHLSTFYFASHPKPVRDAIDTYRRILDSEPYLEVEERMFTDTPGNMQMAIRRDMSDYLGAKPEEIALTGSTTMGLAMVYAGLPLAPGDEVLATTHDHYSHHESIRFATEKAGATMRRIPLYKDAAKATVAEMVASLRAAIRPNTRAVGVTWVHSCTGVRTSVAALAGVIAEANRKRPEAEQVLFIVDGVHALGVVDETVATVGCDFFCSGTHKWMLAPRGTGIVWARADRWARLRPTIPTFASVEAWNAWMTDQIKPHATTAFDMTYGGFHAYEHEWAMSAAFKFHESIGRKRVADRIRELNDRCKAGLAAIHGVRVVTPRDPALSAGIVCFEVNGLSPEDVGKRLLERGIVAGASPYLPSYARFAPSLANSPEEVDEALKAIKAIAAA